MVSVICMATVHPSQIVFRLAEPKHARMARLRAFGASSRQPCPAPRARGWCGRRDLNPHDFHHRNLNPARLPVPPRPLAGSRLLDTHQDAERGAPISQRFPQGLGPKEELAPAASPCPGLPPTFGRRMKMGGRLVTLSEYHCYPISACSLARISARSPAVASPFFLAFRARQSRLLT